MRAVAARPKRYRDTLEWLLRHVEGKRVLYIGTVDDNPDNARKHPPVHRGLARRARSVLGAYRSEAQAASLRAEGLEAVGADVETLNLGQTFEVIVAADTIEHLANAGRFLGALGRHLEAEGILLVSTPNPTSLVRILELLARGRTKANVEHTCWYTAQVLDQLAARFGLRVVEETAIDEMHKYHRPGTRQRSPGAGKRLATMLLVLVNRIGCGLFPQFSETLGLVLARPRRSEGR